MNISGNTIFIPGGTSGIGLGLALRFQSAGNTVIIAGRRTALLESITSGHPGIHSIELDTTDADAVAAVSAEVQQRWPDTNVLLAMAGIMLPEDVHTNGFLATAEATEATWTFAVPTMLYRLFDAAAASGRAHPFRTIIYGASSMPLDLLRDCRPRFAGVLGFTAARRGEA